VNSNIPTCIQPCNEHLQSIFGKPIAKLISPSISGVEEMRNPVLDNVVPLSGIQMWKSRTL
jgi:hypothetical protein